MFGRSSVAVRRGGGSLPAAELDLTVVMPFFNPGPELGATVHDVVGVLRATGATFEVLAVSDGSTDGSEATLRDGADSGVQLVVLPEHAGKGQAVRNGLARGRGRYLGFIQPDGGVPPRLPARSPPPPPP